MAKPLQVLLKRPGSLLTTVNAVFLLCVIAAISLDRYLLLLLPAALLVSLYFFRDLRLTYMLMIMSIPLSIEYSFGSLSLDAPDELFNIFFFCLLPGFLVFNYKRLDFSFIRHPIVVLLTASFVLSVLATCFSVHPVLSVKYLLAKAWYIVAYFGLTALFVRTWHDAKQLAVGVGCTATLTLLYVMVRHAATGFSFAGINFCVGPFYSNHVNYAVQLLVVFPLIWMLGRMHRLRWGQAYVYTGLIALFIAGIYFSYTRAAIGALFLLVPFYYVVRRKLAGPAIILTVIGVVAYTVYMIRDNRFFDYAPDFNKTISHQDFDKLLTATYNFEDISTMERVYRWVAARYMIADKPLLGFGPNNFYDTYKSYTLNSFRTYVSDNPERSTVHSYLLLLAIEQGVLAPVLFLLLVSWALITGQRMYHEEEDPNIRYVIMAAMMILFALMVILSINDVVESDKEGSFFYISLALIAGFHWRRVKARRQLRADNR